MNTGSLVPCPGCGGRNLPDAVACDWCGRPFVTQKRRVSVQWVRLASSLGFGGLVVVIVVLAVLNASRPTSEPGPPATATPTRSTSAEAAPVVLRPTATPAPTATPEPSPTPELLSRARVANTGGLGVFLRREPSASAPAITALREGTEVTVLNQEQVTAARVWRLVRDARNLEGWVLADYLEFIPG